jgi:hypothetical protein
MILYHTAESYGRHEPLTRAQLRSKVMELFNVTPVPTWPYGFLNGHSDNITLCLATPLEESRMNVTKAAARQQVQNPIDFVQNIHMELIFNMDEVGSEEWADRKPKNIFAPTARAEETVYYAVKRGGR